MEHHNNDNLALAILSYGVSFWGQIAIFGLEVLKAAILGFIGAAAGLSAKWLYNKYIRKK